MTRKSGTSGTRGLMIFCMTRGVEEEPHLPTRGNNCTWTEVDETHKLVSNDGVSLVAVSGSFLVSGSHAHDYHKSQTSRPSSSLAES